MTLTWSIVTTTTQAATATTTTAGLGRAETRHCLTKFTILFASITPGRVLPIARGLVAPVDELDPRYHFAVEALQELG